MKILLVNWQDRENPQAGGAEIHLHEIFGRLAARGHEVTLLCGGWPNCPPRVTLDGIDVIRIGTRLTWPLLARGAYKRLFGDHPHDVLVEDINKLPLFLPTMTTLPFCAIVPHLFGTTAFQEASWPMAAIVALAERPIPSVYRRAGFHAISESTGEDLVARGIARERVRVIHPGIDAESYTPARGLDRADPPTFLYVGRLKRYKGVEVAIRALAIARRQRPGLSIDIAGTGDDADRLATVAAELGQRDAVRFHGFVTEARKRELFRTTWANLFPSPKEGWGLTVMEAAACGTPSLASDSPGLRDSVRHGETGLLVPHGNAEALAEGILRFAADPALVERMGEAARRHALAWSWDDAASATAAHLEELVAGTRPLPPRTGRA